MHYKKFERNTAGRDFAIGDIHGCFSKVADCLRIIGFDRAVDRLFSVGDLVDRGPESADVLAWISQPWFHAIQGNHEDMAIRWPNGGMPRDNYRANGGGWNMDLPIEHSREIADALAKLPIAIEVDTGMGPVGLVHADTPGDDWRAFVALLQAGRPEGGRDAMAFDHMVMIAQWSRDRVDFVDRSQVNGVRAVLVGHTPMKAYTSLGNTRYLDTGGWLPAERGYPGFTIVELESLEVAKGLKKAIPPQFLS